MRCATSFAAALLVGFGLAAHAQDTSVKSKAKIEKGKEQPVTFTGCVQSGSEARTYLLEKVVPVSRTPATESTGTSGVVTTTSTTYALVPGGKVELAPHVGHKAEVTGVVIPAGDSKTKTKTTIEREGARDTKISERTKNDNDHPRLKVISVKPLQEPC
jgi:hypothetical protein